MPEKLEIKAEEVEEKIGVGAEVSHDPCESIGYCYQHSHSVSNEVRWNKCHTINHLNCGYRNLLRKLGAL